MKKFILFGAVIAALGLGIVCGYGQNTPAQPKKLNDLLTREMGELMNKKLGHAQKILDGVSRNNFDVIADNANELIALSNREEWMVLKTPTYELYSNAFRRSAEDMVRNAKAKNIDATALAYFDLTMSCVKCHRYVREVRDVRLDPVLPGGRGELEPLVRRDP
jgi:hypothetical protein